jgi:hypothetical protein
MVLRDLKIEGVGPLGDAIGEMISRSDLRTHRH